jgi:hypothetical protein
MRPCAVARALVSALVVALVSPAARGQGVRYGLRFEAGAEHDTNVARVERLKGEVDKDGPPLVASPLGRFVASGDLVAYPGGRQIFSLSASLAGKKFADQAARLEDVLVGQAASSYGASFASSTTLSIGAGYFDVVQREGRFARDFRSVAPTLRLDQGMGAAGLVSAGVGYRWFTYKPFRDYDFAAPTAFVGYRHLIAAGLEEGGADWEWNTSAGVESRAFAGALCPSAENCPPAMVTGSRADRFWTGHTELTRTGRFLLGGGAAVHVNRSNSYGESLVRGLLHVRGSVLLPWQLALTTRVELALTRYADKIPLARDRATGLPVVSIEDEGRSTIRAELVRPVGAAWDLGVRYSLYTNELRADQVSFRRQTFLFFGAFAIEK